MEAQPTLKEVGADTENGRVGCCGERADPRHVDDPGGGIRSYCLLQRLEPLFSMT